MESDEGVPGASHRARASATSTAIDDVLIKYVFARFKDVPSYRNSRCWEAPPVACGIFAPRMSYKRAVSLVRRYCSPFLDLLFSGQ